VGARAHRQAGFGEYLLILLLYFYGCVDVSEVGAYLDSGNGVFYFSTVSFAIKMPSIRWSSFFWNFDILRRISSGTITPGTSFFMNSALRALASGQTLATTGILKPCIFSRKAKSSSTAKTGCVMRRTQRRR
jgi:hypothetical protein